MKLAWAARAADYIDRGNEYIGRAVSWLALAMALVQTIIIGALFFFHIGALWLQESILYMNGALFMLALGWTLKHDEHVRVDIFYRKMTPIKKAWVDLCGVIFFLLPACWMMGAASAPYALSSWAIWEGSRETNGIQALFLLKTIIPATALLLGLQAVSMAARALCVIADQDEHK